MFPIPKQPTALARPNTPIVGPAKAGTQGRGAARGRPRLPSFLLSPPRHSCAGRNPEERPRPFVLSLSKACPEGTRRGPPPPKHTLTRAPGAQANAPVTLPPCNTHAMTSTRTSPQLLRRGAPHPHRAYRQSPPLPRLTAGGCFARAQKWHTDRCSWDEYPSYQNTPRSDTGPRNNLLALPAPAPATPASNRDLRRQEIGGMAKGGVPERCQTSHGPTTQGGTPMAYNEELAVRVLTIIGAEPSLVRKPIHVRRHGVHAAGQPRLLRPQRRPHRARAQGRVRPSASAAPRPRDGLLGPPHARLGRRRPRRNVSRRWVGQVGTARQPPSSCRPIDAPQPRGTATPRCPPAHP